MTREEAHKLVDKLFELEGTRFDEASTTGIVGDTLEAPTRTLPEGKRVVRTASSGDRVYLLDDVKKTRAWVTNPDVLDSLGFELGDVGEVTEDEMLKFQMSAALYKRVDG